MDDPTARLRDFRRALTRLGDRLAATSERPAMVSALLDVAADYLRADAGVFYVVVAGSERLRAMEAVGRAAAPAELARGEGVAGAAAASAAAALAPGTAEVATQEPGEPGAPALALPVRSGGHPLGVLAYYGRAGDQPFTDDDVDALAILARQAETAIENSFLTEEATKLSLTDGLTGLWNRRHFDLRVESELSRAVRFSESFAVLMVDVDRFKPVNDTHGHQAGDTVLVELARRFTEAIREVDEVARYGGEEFVFLLPNTGLAGALRLAEKVRAVVADQPFRLDTACLDLTVSTGVAAYPVHGSSGKDLVAAADAALYRAKAAGGNRVEHAHNTETGGEGG